MKKYNFGIEIKGLDGVKFENTHLGKVIAEAIISTSKGDAIKVYRIATELYAGEVELDDSDKKMLSEMIESSDKMTLLVKAQALQLLQ